MLDLPLRCLLRLVACGALPLRCRTLGNAPSTASRWIDQNGKGFMWRDIGLNDWLFDLDKEEELKRVVPAVLAMARDPAAAKAKAAKAREFVEKRQRETMAMVKAAANT